MSLISPSHMNIPLTFFNNKNYSLYSKENIDPYKFFEKMSYQNLYDDLMIDSQATQQTIAYAKFTENPNTSSISSSSEYLYADAFTSYSNNSQANSRRSSVDLKKNNAGNLNNIHSFDDLSITNSLNELNLTLKSSSSCALYNYQNSQSQQQSMQGLCTSQNQQQFQVNFPPLCESGNSSGQTTIQPLGDATNTTYNGANINGGGQAQNNSSNASQQNNAGMKKKKAVTLKLREQLDNLLFNQPLQDKFRGSLVELHDEYNNKNSMNRCQ